MPAPVRATGGGLRGRDVLRAALDEGTAACGRPRLRRHRVPTRGRGGGRRRPCEDPRARRGPGARRERHLAPQSLPGGVRAGAGGDAHGRRRDAAPGDDRADRRGRHRRAARGRDGRRGREQRRCRRCRRVRHRSKAGIRGPRRRSRLRAAGRRATAPAAPSRRHRRPDLPRRLPREPRLPGAPPGARDGQGSGDPRGHRIEARRSRWRRFSDGTEVVRRREPAGTAALRRLQRRRVRARHLQQPGADGARPVRRHRVDDDRGLRRRLGHRLPVHPGRVPARGERGSSGRSRRRAPPATSGQPSSAATSRSTSSSGAAPAPTSAARRRRSSSPSRASAASRATSRRSRSRSGCSASRRRSTTSRPSSTSSPSSRTAPAAGRSSRRSAPRARPGRSSSASRAVSLGRVSTR